MLGEDESPAFRLRVCGAILGVIVVADGVDAEGVEAEGVEADAMGCCCETALLLSFGVPSTTGGPFC